MLLNGEAVDYTFRKRTTEIKFLHRERYYLNLDNHIPIYVAANGPKAVATGAYGDGWVTVGGESESFKSRLEQTKLGLRLSKNRWEPQTSSIAGCVLRPGEKLTDDRVINEGSWVICELYFYYEI